MHDGASDREAEERAKFDIRWKYALDLGVDADGFDATTLCRFRARLLANEQERSLFEGFVLAARDAGLLSGRQILDSTAVSGAAAVKDTYQLIRGAVRKLCKKSRRVPGLTSKLAKVLQRDDYDEVGKAQIDWSNKEAQETLLHELVADGRAAVAVAREALVAGGGDETVVEAVDLLARIVEQDVEPADGGVQIRQGVAKDRIISVVDPDMRHGHKTSSGRFDGMKAHVAMDAASELITDIEAIAANAPDQSAVAGVLERNEQRGLEVSEITGDHAYGGMPTRTVCSDAGVDLVAPLARPGAPEGKFGKEQFRIDLKEPSCICPAGASGRPSYTRAGLLRGFKFDAATCASCPLKEHCTKAKARHITIQPDEAERQRIYAQQATPQFQKRYRQRPLIERAHAELARIGIHQARYRGLRKERLQLAFSALVVNIQRAASRGLLPAMVAARPPCPRTVV